MTETRWDILTTALEHARSMFIYHAGQRVVSLRFYVTALAFLVAAIVSVVTVQSFPQKAAVGMLLSASVLILTICLWALDWRNSMLVHCDENLLKAIERELATLSQIPALTIIEDSNRARPIFVRYPYILGVMFGVFAILSILGFWFFLRL